MKTMKYLPIIMMVIGFIAAFIGFMVDIYLNEIFVLVIIIWMIFWAFINELIMWIKNKGGK